MQLIGLEWCSHDDSVMTAMVVPATIPFSQSASATAKHHYYYHCDMMNGIGSGHIRQSGMYSFFLLILGISKS
jgi:meiotically up-regulated gene 157 (Mug157) protein